MEICAFCEGEGFIMNGMSFNNCRFCKGSGVIGRLRAPKEMTKKVDIHKSNVPKKPIYRIDKRNI